MKRWMVAVVLLLGMTYVGMAIAEEAKSLERQQKLTLRPFRAKFSNV